MTFMELAKSRFSVRKFSDKAVEEEKLAKYNKRSRKSRPDCADG